MADILDLVASGPMTPGTSDRASVMQMQSILNELGYNVSVDGDFGDITETVLKEFQFSHNVAPTGLLDNATVRALSVALPPTGLVRQAWPSQYRPDCTNFYGDPDPGQSGHLSALWQREYLIHVPPVYPMVWDLDPGEGRGQPVRYWTINKRCADSAIRCFKAILASYPNRSDLEKAHLHWWGGSFEFRAIRGSHTMSCHALGAAIDLAPTWNPQHKRYNEAEGMLPSKVIDIFEAEGWIWGGRWSAASVDCMHFQAAHL
jgi:D-alanyl-D-alanine carboxypeptidase/Putative peptidoglycan binding domain